MSLLKALGALLLALPELIKLIENLQREASKIETDRKVKDDLKIINHAFENNDAEALRILFNS